jgi:hypothetical protein
MESRVKTLMQRLDDKLDHHPRGYVFRNYAIYADYLTGEGERYPPVVDLIINNPRGRVGKSKPRFPSKEQDDTFKIILEIGHPPYLGNDNLDRILEENGFTVPTRDDTTSYPYWGVGVLCKESLRGELTLANYETIFGKLIEMYDMLGWGNRVGKPLKWLYDMFKEVYAGAPPPGTEPPQRRKLKRRKLF